MATSKRCFYEVLGVDQHALEDEIKKSYRRLALKFHPDKNPGDNEAHIQFLDVQEAYETLSDAQERAWYDSHKTQILRGEDVNGSGDDPSAARINIYRWFRKDCFSGFSESVDGMNKPKCFYTVYRGVFDVIAEEEIKHTESPKASTCEMFKTAPTFGTSTSPNSEVNSFYRFWSVFLTQRDFSFADEWNLSEGPNRFVRRQMEAENRKKRKDARKEFNDTVRALVEFVKKRDPRLIAARLDKVAQTKYQDEKEAERKAQLAQERKRLRELAIQEEIQRWEEIKKEKASKNQVFLDEGSDEAESIEGDEKTSKGNWNIKRERNVCYVCEACSKTFKTEMQFKQHEKSKKHIVALNALIKRLEEEQSSGIDESTVDVEEDQERDEPEQIPSENDEADAAEGDSYIDLDGGSNPREKSSLGGSGRRRVSERSRKSTDSNALSAQDSSSDSELLGRLQQLRVSQMVSINEAKNKKFRSDSESSEDLQIKGKAKLDHQHSDNERAFQRSGKRKKNKGSDSTKAQHQMRKQNLQEKPVSSQAETRSERCTICNSEFSSRNKLFQHIKDTGHAALRDSANIKKKRGTR